MLLLSIILILEEVVNLKGKHIMDYNILDYGFDPMGVIFDSDAEVLRRKRISRIRKPRLSLPDGFDKFDMKLSEIGNIDGTTTPRPETVLKIFPSLENYHEGANEVDEADYPWVAKVVHSTHNDYPVICTASCIDDNIFVTSARCLFSLRPLYTRVFYNGHSFSSKAFITPSLVTKQSFDDIGFIVVLSNNSYTREWPTVRLYNERRRTDDVYNWFAEYLRENGHGDHIAVGWTVHKTQHKIKKPKTPYTLTELEIVLGLDLCAEIFTVNFKIEGFYVPCYFGCDIKEFIANDTKCERAHGAEGGAIFNTKTNSLLGIATWGAFYNKRELPLGFSVANSDNFYKDKECAIKIRNDNQRDPPSDYLQSLCPDDGDPENR